MLICHCAFNEPLLDWHVANINISLWVQVYEALQQHLEATGMHLD